MNNNEITEWLTAAMHSPDLVESQLIEFLDTKEIKYGAVKSSNSKQISFVYNVPQQQSYVYMFNFSAKTNKITTVEYRIDYEDERLFEEGSNDD